MFVIRRVCVVTEAERKERKRRRKEKKENRRARAVAMRTAKHGIVCFGVVMCGERPARGFSRCSFFRFVLRLFALGLACSVVFSRSFVLDNKNIVQNATSIDPHLRRRLNGIFRYLLLLPRVMRLRIPDTLSADLFFLVIYGLFFFFFFLKKKVTEKK